MKIAIPVNKESMDGGVCLSFGRAPYFLIYDMDSEKSNFITNAAAESQGGAGIKAAQLIVDNGVEALITPRCGKNAADVLNAAEIKLYNIKSDSVEDNIKAFADKELPLLDEIHAGFHNHGRK